MSAKSFLIAHGEKLVVVAIAAGCAYVLYDHVNDPGFRPKEDSAKIDAININIEKAFNLQEPPVIKPSRPYLDQLLARLAEQPAIAPKMAWTTVPPDLSRTPSGDVPYFYVYQLPAPVVTLKDVVGQLEITIAMEADAKAPTGSGRRVSAEAERSWTRTAATGPVTNTAHHLGICVEIKIGDNGEFKPLALPGASKDGVLPLTALNTPIIFAGAEPWQRHYVRARLVAAATAFDPKTTELRPRATVLVMPGILSGSLVEDQRLLTTLEGQWSQLKKGVGPDWAKILPPEGNLALPAGAQIAPGERVFRGPATIEKMGVSGSVRFALVGVGQEMDDKGQPHDIAKFKFLKRFVQGDQTKWLEKPIDQKSAVGEKLGSVVKGRTPFTERIVEIDLQTPFVVSKVMKAQPRVLYWLIKTKPRPGGGKDRDLELDKREQPTDIVVLKNPASGNEMTLTKLGKVNPPPQAKVVVYPFRAGPVDEFEEFTKAPTEFQQYDLVPAEPKSHEPGRGPLAALYATKKAENAPDLSIYQTDTTYYELADGRIVWWESGNKEVIVHDPNGVEKPAAKEPTPAPGPGPAAPPGATPPGAMSPDAMPPGMPPGFAPPAPPRR